MLWKWLSCLILWELDADEKIFHQTPNPNPDPGPDPGDGDDRHVRRPGHGAVLRLLRDRATAYVLHDRRVGRAEPALRLAQVLPVHPLRLRPHARQLPGPVLPDRCRVVRIR